MMQLISWHTVASAAVSTGPGDWWHMGGWGWGMVVFGWLFMVAIVGVVVWLVATSVRRQERSGGSHRGAVDVLDERYARGEIDREEYLQRRADLGR